jgi:hypothetical protein
MGNTSFLLNSRFRTKTGNYYLKTCFIYEKYYVFGEHPESWPLPIGHMV